MNHETLVNLGCITCYADPTNKLNLYQKFWGLLYD